MNKKDRAALEDLERALLEDEETTTQPETPEEPMVFRNYSNNYGANLRNYASGYQSYNTDSTDTDPEDLSDRILTQPEEKLGGLLLTAALLLLGILAVAAFWVVQFFGGL